MNREPDLEVHIRLYRRKNKSPLSYTSFNHKENPKLHEIAMLVYEMERIISDLNTWEWDNEFEVTEDDDS